MDTNEKPRGVKIETVTKKKKKTEGNILRLSPLSSVTAVLILHLVKAAGEQRKTVWLTWHKGEKGKWQQETVDDPVISIALHCSH